MTHKDLPDPDLLRKLLRYEPETGKLFWRERSVDMFSDTPLRSASHSCRIWNARYATKEAFTYQMSCKYKQGRIFDVSYLAHRVAWVLYYGVWPNGQIDHINGNRVDNKIQNLRDTTNTLNQRNSRKSKNNKSGFNGVCWHKASKKWHAQITIDTKSISLGIFSDIHEAVAARANAERGHGFTERHGK